MVALRVSVAADGTLAAIHEPSRVRLLELPGGDALAEIGVDPSALASEVAWVGAPPRLLVLARYAAHSTVHLLDPYGPRTLAEIQLPSPMRLLATVGSSALVIGPQSAAVLVASDSYLMPYQFPARVMPVAAGAAAGQFVVALAGSIEEWDPQSRMPKRRLRLPRAAAITAVGGSERVVWMTTREEPARIDVIPLANRGQPKAHDLPEPIARVAGHPRSDLVACIGAETGRLYIVDLDGRARLRAIEPSGIERIDAAALIVGRMLGVLAAQAQRPIAIVPLDSRDFGSTSGAGIVLPSSDPAIRLPPPDEPDAPREAPKPPRRPPSAGAPTERAGSERAEPAESAEPEESDERKGRRPAFAGGRLSVRLEGPSLPPQAAPPPTSSARPASPPLRSSSPSLQSPQTRVTPSATAKLATPAPSGTPVLRSPAASVAPPSTSPSPPGGAGAAAGKRMSAWRDLVRQTRERADPIASVTEPVIEPVSVPANAPVSVAATTPTIAPVIALTPEPAGSPPRSEARSSWRDEIAEWARAGAVDSDTPSAAPAIDTVIARFELAQKLRQVLVMLYGAHLCGERGVAPAEIARILDHSWDEALGRGELARRGVVEHIGSRVALSPLLLRVLDELPPATGTLVGEPGLIAQLGPYVVVAGDEPLPVIAAQCLPLVGGAILAAHDGADRAELLLEARALGATPMLRLAASPEDAPSEPAIFVVGDAALADRVGLPRLA